MDDGRERVMVNGERRDAFGRRTLLYARGQGGHHHTQPEHVLGGRQDGPRRLSGHQLVGVERAGL